ncbi:SDR family NAD(P)-dependent oxidoreductase [Flavobacterium sp. I-SCBP12n]|uniref:SDR family NAD(P)-dependent oxidoreductase n=1 Tax=Flavobacterium pygoscelis TaxID=2893176 RepID=A0A9X1XV37_9FLAO|nr:SDR family NAD(P)-dependent oxidoreductase [Flavobacterium pygoscelis]MCK8143418.1 SDR family NAD(P)-dependent oxidoreductase [Flavobacterium pygoscelis]
MNKTILITGASKGIGFSLAKKFLENGFKVIGTSRSGKIEGIINESFETLQLDLSDFKNIEILKKEINDKGRKIDILINNAGIGPDLDFNNPEEITFKQTFDVNVIGTTFLTEVLIENINIYGKIINISSKMGSIELCERIDSVAYRMSKTALNMYTKILSNRLSEKTKVASVHPGWVRTTIAKSNITEGRLSSEESANGIFNFAISEFRSGIYWDVETETELAW